MRIQHNIMAMNAYRNLGKNNGALSKNLEKLSSGFRINRAGDDAAGLAISEKMRSQIAGLDQAQKNAQSGINMVQTAEGALTEVHDMLNRMVTLSTQAANGTYIETDRQKIQSEINALTDEINRIAENSNFNGQKLLNGELETGRVLTSETTTVTTPGTTDAISNEAVKVQDGQTATPATTAKVTIKLDGTNATVGGLSAGIQGGTTTVANLGAMTANGVALKDLFTLKVGGVDTAWTANTAITAGATIELEAKNAGALESGVISDLQDITGASSLNVVNGSDTGTGAAATKAEYKLDFDVTKISGGDTFSIGGKTFEFVTDGGAVSNANNVKIDITGMNSADTAQAGGQYKMMNAIHTAVSGAMTDYTASAAPSNTATNAGTYTLTLIANDAGLDGNNGEVRDVETTSGGVAGTYTAGKVEGVGQAGQFAQVSYAADLTKLAVGDKLTIGGISLTVADVTDLASSNKTIAWDDAKNGATLAATFEAAGYTAGKISYADGKLTLTNTNTTDDAETFAGGNGELVFEPKTAAVEEKTESTTVETKGQAMVLQIGASVEESIEVKVKSMKAEDLGIKDLSVLNETDAKTSLEKINAAIEKVSVQRSDLGAIQNRLEHTINNLGVMEENIQDAEANIRDTDIAEEMMAYTKNNILIQSAQAMLAQANQVPQGVLQLMG